MPLLRGGQLLGVLDLDSPRFARFGAGGREALEALATDLVAALRTGRLAGIDVVLSYLARETYSRVRVSTRTISPSLMNSGTRTTAPVSSLAGLLAAGRGVAPQARVGLDDLELDVRRRRRPSAARRSTA